jgi:hypothetical protein
MTQLREALSHSESKKEKLKSDLQTVDVNKHMNLQLLLSKQAWESLME